MDDSIIGDLLLFDRTNLFKADHPGDDYCQRDGNQYIRQFGIQAAQHDHDRECDDGDDQGWYMGSSGRRNNGIPYGFVMMCRFFDIDAKDLAEL